MAPLYRGCLARAGKRGRAQSQFVYIPLDLPLDSARHATERCVDTAFAS
jgi:hypothetical protein